MDAFTQAEIENRGSAVKILNGLIKNHPTFKD